MEPGDEAIINRDGLHKINKQRPWTESQTINYQCTCLTQKRSTMSQPHVIQYNTILVMDSTIFKLVT